MKLCGTEVAGISVQVEELLLDEPAGQLDGFSAVKPIKYLGRILYAHQNSQARVQGSIVPVARAADVVRILGIYISNFDVHVIEVARKLLPKRSGGVG